MARDGRFARDRGQANEPAGDPFLADVAATAPMLNRQRKARDLALSSGIRGYFVIGEDHEFTGSGGIAEKLETNRQ